MIKSNKQPKNRQSTSHDIPHDNTIEQQLIGCILLRPDCMHEIRSLLKPDDFLDEAHRAIYNAATDIYDDIGDVDAALIATKLRDTNQLQKAGGIPYLGQCSLSVGTTRVVKYYADRIASDSHKRQMLLACETATDAVLDPSRTADQVHGEIRESLDRASRPQIQEVRSMESLVLELVDHLESAETIDRRRQVSTGIFTVDQTFDPFFPGELVTIAARTGVGKTTFLGQMAAHNASHGRQVLFVNLEMTNRELVIRQVAHKTHINTRRIRQGRISDDEKRRIVSSVHEIAMPCWHCWSGSSATVSTIRSMAVDHRNKFGLEVIVVDYLQLIDSDTKKDTRELEVNHAAKALKALAKELDCVVVAACQLHAGGPAEAVPKRPTINMVKESRAVVDHSDVLVAIYRPDFEKNRSAFMNQSDRAEIIFLKVRNGAVGLVEVDHDPGFGFVSDKALGDF